MPRLGLHYRWNLFCTFCQFNLNRQIQYNFFFKLQWLEYRCSRIGLMRQVSSRALNECISSSFSVGPLTKSLESERALDSTASSALLPAACTPDTSLRERRASRARYRIRVDSLCLSLPLLLSTFATLTRAAAGVGVLVRTSHQTRSFPKCPTSD